MFMKYIKRHLEKVVNSLMKSFPAILITGPRQCGKTTMLQNIVKNEKMPHTYITLDDLMERDLAKNDPKMFLELHKPPLFIDEIQYAPELFTYIKIYVDKYKTPGSFLLTGSQIFKLMENVQESLAGRIAVLQMTTLSQREISGADPMPLVLDYNRLLEEEKKIPKVSMEKIYGRIWHGSMPKQVSENFENRNIFYSSYISTYIERDVKNISNAIDQLKFKNFIISVAARTTQLLNYASIARDADISEATAKSWLKILETLGIIFLLYPYSNNVLKRTIKTPKVYFYDTGLVSYFTKWSSTEVLMNGAMSGSILENYVIAEIMKNFINTNTEPFVNFYRDKDMKEIDLIIEQDGLVSPIEIKRTMVPDRKILKVFDIFENNNIKRGTSAVLCLADKLSAFDRDNLIVPINLL